MAAEPFTSPHIGLTIPVIEDAIAWYTSILGFRLLAGPIEVTEDDTPLGLVSRQIYGEGFSRFIFAHLATPDDVGLELFQFDTPPGADERNTFEPRKAGYHHIGLTAPDIQATADAMVAAGGRARTPVLTVNADKGYRIAYLEDPWGTVIELCSHPYVTMWQRTTAPSPEAG